MSGGGHGVNDPTIPRSRSVQRQGNAAERGAPPGPVEGRLIDYGDRLVLADSRNNDWTLDRVRMVTGGFGSSRSGVERAPRPWKYGPNNEVLIAGDFLLIFFPEEDSERPVIMGGVRSLVPEDETFFARQAADQNPNRLAMRQVQADATGQQTGCWDMEVFADDAKQQMEMRVTLPTGKTCRIKFDAAAGTVSIGAGSENERPILGDAFLGDYALVIDDLIAIGIAAGSPALNAVSTKVQLANPDSFRSTTIKVE